MVIPSGVTHCRGITSGWAELTTRKASKVYRNGATEVRGHNEIVLTLILDKVREAGSAQGQPLPSAHQAKKHD